RTVQRLAHSLKGIAGTIEAAALQKAAAAVEKALEEHQREIALKQLHTLEELFEPLIRQIRQALLSRNEEPTTGDAPSACQESEPLIARLETLLQEGSPHALTCLTELEIILPAATRLRPLIRKFAFEDALVMLTTIRPKN
ncbi:Hpt domain-containing protein, partial [Pontiella sp.]|uniref:Hpt domain-containing protein n=1 Tax=Pontiella sp. TaxID=2837462 RepID=UPI0035638C93